jgi:hypothetical protein
MDIRNRPARVSKFNSLFSKLIVNYLTASIAAIAFPVTISRMMLFLSTSPVFIPNV